MNTDLSKYKSDIKVSSSKDKKKYLELEVYLPLDKKENEVDTENEKKYLYYFVKEKNYFANYKLGNIENFDNDTIQYFSLSELFPPLSVMSLFVIAIIYSRLKYKKIKFKKSFTFLSFSFAIFSLTLLQSSIQRYYNSFIKRNIITNNNNNELEKYSEWKKKNNLL